jgi:CheY-like chemotaxis protein
MKKSDFTILVADDDPDYLFQTVFNLEKAGYKTIKAESWNNKSGKHTLIGISIYNQTSKENNNLKLNIYETTRKNS